MKRHHGTNLFHEVVRKAEDNLDHFKHTVEECPELKLIQAMFQTREHPSGGRLMEVAPA